MSTCHQAGETPADKRERDVVTVRFAFYAISEWVLVHMRVLTAELHILIVAIRPESLGPLCGVFREKHRHIGPGHESPLLQLHFPGLHFMNSQ
ncbi:hypothetical protein OHT76_24030 [Streptomyces sp. NBC_00287]|uniref:hypothetical protein n=1 Tax=Streptomyces sp. NBC_00287 TaxID=2975702 RepID=UPI002E2AF074|nr:hypothetical protein [Streptomyces sp. NBC_00287]